MSNMTGVIQPYVRPVYPDAHDGKQIHADLITVTEAAYVLRLVRQTNCPNQNFYEVYADKRKLGYLSYPPASYNWFAVISWPEDDRQCFPTIEAGMDWFKVKLDEILNPAPEKESG